MPQGVPLLGIGAGALGVLLVIVGVAIRLQRPRGPAAPPPPSMTAAEPAASPPQAPSSSTIREYEGLLERERTLNLDLDRQRDVLLVAGTKKEFACGIRWIDPSLSRGIDWEIRRCLQAAEPSTARVDVEGATDPSGKALSCPAVVLDASGLLLVTAVPRPENQPVLRVRYLVEGPGGLEEREDARPEWVAWHTCGAGILRIHPEGKLHPAGMESAVPVADTRLLITGLCSPGTEPGVPHGCGAASVRMGVDGHLLIDFLDDAPNRLSAVAMGTMPVFAVNGNLVGFTYPVLQPYQEGKSPDEQPKALWVLVGSDQVRDLVASGAGAYALPKAPGAPRGPEVPYDLSAAIPVKMPVAAIGCFGSGDLLVVRAPRGGCEIGPCELVLYPPGSKKPSFTNPLGIGTLHGCYVAQDGTAAYVGMTPQGDDLPTKILRVDRELKIREFALPGPISRFSLSWDGHLAISLGRTVDGVRCFLTDLVTGSTRALSLSAQTDGYLLDHTIDAIAGWPVLSEANGMAIVWHQDSRILIGYFIIPGDGVSPEELRQVAVSPVAEGTEQLPWQPFLDIRTGRLFAGAAVCKRTQKGFECLRTWPETKWPRDLFAQIAAYNGVALGDPSRMIVPEECALALSRDGKRLLTRMAIRDSETLECNRVLETWSMLGCFSPDGTTCYVVDELTGNVLVMD